MPLAAPGADGPRWRRIAREPLAQFLAAGALVLAMERAASRGRASDDDRAIVIDDAVIERMRGESALGLGRAPSDAELRDAIDQFIDEEVLYREAKRLGLDRDDRIVRRRLVQKEEFLIDDLHPIREPTPGELSAYLAAHEASFRTPARVTFEHLLFSRDRRGDHAEGDARRALAAIESGEPPPASDPFLAGTSFVERTERELDAAFGAGFGAKVMAVSPARWSGPISSTFGVHLVRVSALRPSQPAAVDDVRAELRQAVIDDRRRVERESARAELRRSYRISDVRTKGPR